MMERYDVAVVGAGVSGLAAARALVGAGRRVVVLESRERVGGRLLRHRDGPLDLGATWFWPGEERVARLVDELALAIHPQHLSGDALYHVPGGVQRLDGNPIDVAASRFSDGAASLADGLSARLPDGVVRPGRRIVALTVADDGVVVTDVHGDEFRADDVILALPPALAVRTIDMRSSVDERTLALAAATPVWMGSIAKVVVEYATPFWRDDGLAGAAISHLGPLREVHDMSGPGGHPAALFGFVPLRGHEPPPEREAIVGQLVELFGAAAATPIDLVVHDWRTESDTITPDAVGLAAYATYGHERFATPTGEGRVHWASTETAPVNPGHIEGALAAAERAVAAVLHRDTSPPRSAPSPVVTPTEGTPR